MDQERGKVIGLGGIFFKSADQKNLANWYAEKLGMKDTGSGVLFRWREFDAPDQERMTIWSIFRQDSTYFDPSKAPFMVNLVVDDLDALLHKLETADVKIDPKREDHEYGRFAWIYDSDGNKIELWQPLG